MARPSVRSGLLVLLLAAAGTAPAGAAPEWTVEGTVTDVRGTPLSGVQVSRGNLQVLTDDDGHYELVEPLPRTGWITVQKVGYDTAYRQVSPVDAVGPVDFSLLFRMRFTDVAPRAAAAGQPARTAIVWAANPPGSCARFHDLESGTDITLTPGTTVEAGTVAWTAPFPIAETRPDGAYLAEGVLYDCSTLQELSATTSRTYHVDSIGPSVTGLSPADGLIVNSPDVVLSGVITDAESGLSPWQPASFSMKDVTAGESGFSPVSHVGGADTKSRHYSARVALIETHVYTFRLKGTDAAGNVTFAEATFTAGTPTPPIETTLVAPYTGGEMCGVIVCVPDPLSMAGRLEVATADGLGREVALIRQFVNVTGPGFMTVWVDFPDASGDNTYLCVFVNGRDPLSGSACSDSEPILLGGVYPVSPGDPPVIDVSLNTRRAGDVRGSAVVSSIRYSFRP